MQSRRFYVGIVLCWLAIAICINRSTTSIAKVESTPKKYKIGLLIMATGPYVSFVPRLLESAQKYFLTNHTVTYFVFTEGELPAWPNVIKVPQGQLGWPYDTMMRFHTYYKHKELFTGMDYLFALDADMQFVAPVGDEIISKRVGTLQPNYLFDPKPYETNPISTSCINRGEGKHYFAGAFYGGTRDEFIKLIKTAMTNINTDLARGVIASVNDESHLNRYFVDNEPTLILNASYCHFESWDSPYPKKLVAFDKADHDKGNKRRMRSFNAMEYYMKMLREQL